MPVYKCLVLCFCTLLAACSPKATSTVLAPQENDSAAITDTPAAAASQEEGISEGISYAVDIQPIFDNSCTDCHGSSGGLSLEDFNRLMAGGNSGSIVAAGNAGESILVKRLTGEIPPVMPRGGSLSEEKINLIRQWIDEGALNN